MKTSIKERRKGEFYVLSNAVLWAFFPVISKLTFGKLPSLVSLAWSTLFSAIFFFFIVLMRNKWHELVNFQLWKYTFWIVLWIGIIYYALFFTGLTRTSAGNAGIIQLTDIFYAYLFFVVIKKDKFSFEHLLGSLLMVLGVLIIFIPKVKGVNVGDFIILIAMMFPTFGNYIQQKARKIASSESIMFLRSIISTPLLFLLAFVFGQNAPIQDVKSSLVFLLINGAILLGVTKFFWIEAIHRISVAKGAALGSVTPLLTLIISWIMLNEVPNVWPF